MTLAEEEWSGEVQAEALESIGTSLLGPLLQQGTAFIGSFLQGALGLPANRDSPSQIGVSPDDWCLADVPRPIGSLAFKKVHSAPDAKAVVQQNSNRSMDLQQRFQEKSLVASFEATISCTNVSALLGNVSVSPQIFPVVSGNTVTGPFMREETALSYYSNFYTFWRGDLDFHVNVIQCQFQKGQIGIFFNPNNDILTSADFPARTSNLIGQVFDISESNDFVLTVPYVNDRDYKRLVRAYGADTAMTGLSNPWNSVPLSGSLGQVWIYVTNPIVGPATAPQTVYVNVWVSSKNLSYHVPRDPGIVVELNGRPQCGVVEEWIGVVQSESGVILESELIIQNDEDTVAGQNVDETTAENPIEEVAQIATADTQNIAGRNYIIAANIEWPATATRGTIISALDVTSELLYNQDLAPSGLFNFHEFFRGGLVATLKIASQCQYLGLAILAVAPSTFDRPISQCISTLTQLPHAFVDLGRNTTTQVTVPWLHVRRLLRTGDLHHDVATVYLIVINALRAPTGACTTVNSMLTVSLTAPYFGVKKVKPAVLKELRGRVQSKESAPADPSPGEQTSSSAPKEEVTSAMTAKTTRRVKPWKVRNAPTKAYIATHTSVYDLLKRPVLDDAILAPGVSTVPVYFRSFQPLLNPTHLKLITTWAFYNGGTRLHLTSNVNLNISALMMLQPDYNGAALALSQTAVTPAPTKKNFVGTQLWKYNEVPSVVVGLPYYAETPLLFTPQAGDITGAGMERSVGSIHAYTLSAAGGLVTFAHSMGDDFELHFPLPMPQTIVGIAAVAEAREEWKGVVQGWQKDLTQCGDVESNPGPIGYWVKRKLNEIIDDIVLDQTEKARKKLLEAKVFLAKNCFNNVVDDVVIPVLSAFLDIVLHIRLIAIETSKVAIMAAFTAIALRMYPALKDAFGTIEMVRKAFETAFEKPVANDHVAQFWNKKEDWGTSVDVHAWTGSVQAGEPIAGAVAVAALATIAGAFGLTLATTTEKDVKSDANNRFFRSCGLLGKVGQGVMGVRHIWNGVKDGLATAMDYFIDPSPSETWWKDNKDNVELFVSMFRSAASGNLHSADNAFRAFADGLSPFDLIESNAALIDAMIVHFPRLEFKIVPLDYRRALQDIILTRAKLTAQQAATKQRCEPVGVWLYGQAGCGKSVFGKEILPALLVKKLGLQGHWSSHLYQVPRSDEQKHWDGYTGQTIAAIDDFGQATDDKDFIEAISLISSASCPLPMAQLAYKNMTFTSKVVFASTNIANCRGVQSIKDKSAIIRRFGVAVELSTVNKGLLDYSALQKDLEDAVKAKKTRSEVCAVYDKHVKLTKLDIDTGTTQGMRYKLEEFIDLIASEIKKREHASPIGDLLGEVQGKEDAVVVSRGVRYFPYRVPSTKPIVLGEACEVEGDHDAVMDNAHYEWEQTQEEKIFKGIKSVFIALGVTVGSGLILYLIVTLLKTWVFSAAEAPGETQGKYAETKAKAAGPKMMKGNVQNLEKAQKVEANLLPVACGHMSQIGLAVDNKHIIINRHLVELGKQDFIEVQLKKRDGTEGPKVHFAWKGAACFFGDSVDLMLIRLVGANLDHVRSIRHLFMKFNAWTNLPDNFQVRDWQDRVNPMSHTPISLNTGGVLAYKPLCYPIKVRYETIAGDCGKPYYSDVTTQNPFMGIHTGYAKGHALMTPILYEDVMAKIEELAIKLGGTTVIEDYKLQSFQVTGTEVTEFDLGNLELIGQGKLGGQALVAGCVPGTSFVKSPIQSEEWDDSFMPSIKRTVEVEGVRIDPLFSGAQKYELNGNCVEVPYVRDAIVEYCKMVPHAQGRILTEHEMLNGIGEMGRLVTKTSAGIITKFIKKEELFDQISGEVVDGVQKQATLVWSEKARTFIIPYYGMPFQEYFDLTEIMIGEGQKPDLIWTSTLKDELRPKEKAKKGKTRVFENPDIAFTLLVRKYFGHFIQWFKANRGFDLHHAIGIDREVAAPEIYDGLTWKDRIFDVDYKNFDGSVHNVLAEFFQGVTDWYYGPENRTQRHVLLDVLRSSLHLVGDTLFQSYQGNKSGNAMTDVYNSVCNAGMVYIAYRAVYGEVSDIRENFKFITYGDDLIGSASPNIPQFNRAFYASFCGAFGLTVTSAAKDGKMTPFTPRDEVSFLKSTFVDEVPFCFPLPLEIIHRELRWEKKQNKGDNVVLHQRIVQALDMAAHHPRVVYERLERQIKDAGFGDWIDGSWTWRRARLTSKQCQTSLRDSPFNFERHEPVAEELDGEVQAQQSYQDMRATIDLADRFRGRKVPPISLETQAMRAATSCHGTLDLDRHEFVRGWTMELPAWDIDNSVIVHGLRVITVDNRYKIPRCKAFHIGGISLASHIQRKMGFIRVNCQGNWRKMRGSFINVSRPGMHLTEFDVIVFVPQPIYWWSHAEYEQQHECTVFGGPALFQAQKPSEPNEAHRDMTEAVLEYRRDSLKEPNGQYDFYGGYVADYTKRVARTGLVYHVYGSDAARDLVTVTFEHVYPDPRVASGKPLYLRPVLRLLDSVRPERPMAVIRTAERAYRAAEGSPV